MGAGGRRAEGPTPSTQVAGCWGRIALVVAHPSEHQAAPSFHKRPTPAMPQRSSVVEKSHSSHESAPAPSAAWEPSRRGEQPR